MKPAIHKIISEKAVELYNKSSGTPLSDSFSEAFNRGSVIEDRIGLTRLMNWHFYDNNGTIGRYRKFILNCYGSNKNIFSIRLNELKLQIKNSSPAKFTGETAGRIAHHIQDMVSPSHVLPIYHTIDDRFDSYPPVSDRIIRSISPLPSAEMDETFPFRLLNEAAIETINAVNNNVIFDGDITLPGETWQNFWGDQPDKRLRGFVKYGIYGNKFGDARPCIGSAAVSYTKSTFDHFYMGRFNCGVRFTAELLRFLAAQGKDE